MARQLTKAAPIDMAGFTGDTERGEYVLRMAGCIACHTDRKNGGAFLAGGRRLETPFGTFVTPNITSSTANGIGDWSLEEFAVALTSGIAPSGEHYYPAFPYPSYSRMARQDIADLKSHLDQVPPVDNSVPAHELPFPFSLREPLVFWKALFFSSGEFVPEPDRSETWNRGAYLVNGPTHCVECHTARNFLGGLTTEHLAGTDNGPSGERVPSINPRHGGLKDWGIEDFVFALQIGMKPDGDSVGSDMGEVVDDSTAELSEGDLEAIAEYLLSLVSEQ